MLTSEATKSQIRINRTRVNTQVLLKIASKTITFKQQIQARPSSHQELAILSKTHKSFNCRIRMSAAPSHKTQCTLGVGAPKMPNPIVLIFRISNNSSPTASSFQPATPQSLRLKVCYQLSRCSHQSKRLPAATLESKSSPRKSLNPAI